MRRLFPVISVVLLGLAHLPAWAQDKLSVFGFFQTTYSITDFKFEQGINIPAANVSSLTKTSKTYDRALVQQLNLFLSRDLGANFQAWINFELTNSYSSLRSWGNYNLEEAWVKYAPSRGLNIKAGQLIPRFNNLNEVKNRMPYLPYVFRPIIYEASFSEVVPPEDYLPERAYLQVYGAFSAGRAEIDYAVFAGNPENSYIIRSTSGAFVRGEDTTKFNMFGGRVGVKLDGLRLGVSGTLDKDNGNARGLGDIKRTRLGLDAGLSAAGFTLEGELISVANDVKAAGVDMDKLFYYGTALYDFSDRLYGYVSYNTVEDKGSPVLKDGAPSYNLGGGFRFHDSVLIKAQYSYVTLDAAWQQQIALAPPPAPAVPAELSFNLKFHFFFLGMSVMF
jgi:hypothetical protein